MQIVINIDNELYEYFSKRRTMHDDEYFSHIGKLIKALRDGSLLPEGHGQSIDADIITNEFYERYPKNYMGGLELNGSSCVFSYNDIIEIINNIIKSRNTND